MPKRKEWKASLHGGHSVVYCDHARDPLPEMVEAAIAAGIDTWGVTEHAPRYREKHLYPDEIEMGWDLARLLQNFADYAAMMDQLLDDFDGQIELLKGFETEVVPKDDYATIMLDLRKEYNFDYIVGSVHYIDDYIFDLEQDAFNEVVEHCGSLEKLGIKYYRTVAEMVELLKPEVVGHLDLIRKYAPDEESVATPEIKKAAFEALEVIRQHDCILDLNLAGYRKGIGRPYVAPWLIEKATELGIPFCFGDDSHSVEDVGQGLDAGRQYLLENGVDRITVLARDASGVGRKAVPLA